MWRLCYVLCIFLLSGLLPGKALAYNQTTGYDTIRLGGIIVGTDTFAMVFLDDAYVRDKLPQRFVKQRIEFNRLRYNVYRVYPYAVIAASILKDVDKYLDALPDKRARKEYLKTVEKSLNDRFKGELKDLTITQGQILVKLIDRQTGKNCFSIIKEMKGGFNAFIWQSVALIFSNNLKREYDPTDRDKDVEAICQQVEHGVPY